ncbi:hypothetical protein [uncultured Nostoc sp.]|uniref:hypothetical protein n=1 Tax=uncultured Nostoc sp. TaxID=340711 RepID=UPI0035CB323F
MQDCSPLNRQGFDCTIRQPDISELTTVTALVIGEMRSPPAGARAIAEWCYKLNVQVYIWTVNVPQLFLLAVVLAHSRLKISPIVCKNMT